MTAESLALYSGIVLSLVFSYGPGISTRYAALSETTKKLIMLGLLVLVSLAVVGIACSGFGADLGLKVTCDRAGFIGVLKAFVAATIANQGIHRISPTTASVKRAKDRDAGSVHDIA